MSNGNASPKNKKKCNQLGSQLANLVNARAQAIRLKIKIDQIELSWIDEYPLREREQIKRKDGKTRRKQNEIKKKKQQCAIEGNSPM